MSITGLDDVAQKCSRAGCGAAATHTVNWRNPRIHTPERIKVWLACNEHVEYLREYLLARDFPVVVAPLGVEVTTLDGEGARA